MKRSALVNVTSVWHRFPMPKHAQPCTPSGSGRAAAVSAAASLTGTRLRNSPVPFSICHLLSHFGCSFHLCGASRLCGFLASGPFRIRNNSCNLLAIHRSSCLQLLLAVFRSHALTLPRSHALTLSRSGHPL